MLENYRLAEFIMIINDSEFLYCSRLLKSQKRHSHISTIDRTLSQKYSLKNNLANDKKQFEIFSNLSFTR